MRLRLRLAVTTLAVALPMMLGLAWLNQRARLSAEHQELVSGLLTLMLGNGRAQCEADPAQWSRRAGLPLSEISPFHLEGDGPRFGRGRPSVAATSAPEPAPLPELPLGGGPPGPPGPPGMPGTLGLSNPVPVPPPTGPQAHLVPFDRLLHSGATAEPLLLSETQAIEEARAGQEVELASNLGQTRLIVKMPWETGPCAYVLIEPPPHRRAFLPPTQMWLVPLAAVLFGLVISVGPLVQRIQRLTREVRASAAAKYGSVLSVTGHDEIGELAGAFSDAQAEIRAETQLAEQREAALRNFLSNTTHDVMIPLAALQGHLAALAALGTQLPASGVAEVSAASDEAHYLTSLVHNLAIAARLEAGEPDPQRNPVDLNGLVSRAVGRHATIARQHGVALDHGEPPEAVMVVGDVTLLEQAVSNVVGNAVTYNRRGGHVAALLERVGADQFTLRVVDDGPGLDDTALARILERGFRTDAARTRRPGGQGLGMNIANEVARRHGWTLAVKRSEFGGLEVIFGGTASAKPAVS